LPDIAVRQVGHRDPRAPPTVVARTPGTAARWRDLAHDRPGDRRHGPGKPTQTRR